MTRSLLVVLAATGLVFAQDQPNSGGWRRVGDRPPTPAPVAVPSHPAADDPEPVAQSDAFGQPAQQMPAPAGAYRPAYGVPAEVTLRPGTYLTVRLSQTLSSDRNQPGDTFVASLAQ